MRTAHEIRNELSQVRAFVKATEDRRYAEDVQLRMLENDSELLEQELADALEEEYADGGAREWEGPFDPSTGLPC